MRVGKVPRGRDSPRPPALCGVQRAVSAARPAAVRGNGPPTAARPWPSLHRLGKTLVQIDSDVLITHGPSSSQPAACDGGTPMLPGLAERRPFHLITDCLGSSVFSAFIGDRSDPCESACVRERNLTRAIPSSRTATDHVARIDTDRDLSRKTPINTDCLGSSVFSAFIGDRSDPCESACVRDGI